MRSPSQPPSQVPSSSADQNDRTVEPAHVRELEAEAAVEEARQPEDQAVAEDRPRCGAERQQPETGRAEQRPSDLAGGRRTCARVGRSRIEPAAFGLGDEQLDQQRRRQPEQADDDERAAPVQMCGEPAAEEDAERGADRDAKRKEGQRPRALLARKIIGDQRIGRSDPARLADADAHAGKDQLRVILGDAADGGEQAPQRDRAGDDVDPALAVGEPGDRDGDGRVEDAEGDAEHGSAACPKDRIPR